MADLPPDPTQLPGGIDTPLRRVRRAVLETIALEYASQHTTVRAGPDGWQALKDGIRLKVLNEADGCLTYLLELAPGAVLPGHRHPKDEECIVLRGELRMGDALVLRSGDFHLARAGVPHATIVSPTGALLFLRGAPPEAADLL